MIDFTSAKERKPIIRDVTSLKKHLEIIPSLFLLAAPPGGRVGGEVVRAGGGGGQHSLPHAPRPPAAGRRLLPRVSDGDK